MPNSCQPASSAPRPLHIRDARPRILVADPLCGRSVERKCRARTFAQRERGASATVDGHAVAVPRSGIAFGNEPSGAVAESPRYRNETMVGKIIRRTPHRFVGIADIRSRV